MRLKKLIDKYFIKSPRFRRLLTRVIEGDQDQNVSLLGTTLRVNSIKEHGYLRASRLAAKSSLLNDELAPLLNLASLIQDGDTFVDVGANVGIYARTYARFCQIYPNFRVYAFEANPDTFSRLSYQPEHTFTAQALAISDLEGSLQFVGGAVSHVFTTLDKQNAYSIPNALHTIACKRLDQLAIEGNSLIIKIDVEGQELRVLRGASALFQQGRVKAVYLDGYDDDDHVISWLKENGMRISDGRTLKDNEPTFALLALKNT
jgi:FkbM family methyltransferase